MRVKSNSKRGIFAPGDGQPRGSGHVGWLKMQKKSKYIRVQPGHKELPGWHRESCQHSELRHWCHTPLLIRQMRTYLCTAFPGMQWCSGKVLVERVPPTSTLTITRYRTNTRNQKSLTEDTLYPTPRTLPVPGISSRRSFPQSTA